MTLTSLLVGGPRGSLAGGWDPGPLVLALTFVVGMRGARIPLRTPLLVAALLAGLAADLAADVAGLSLLSAVSLSIAVWGLVVLRRRARERRSWRV